MANARRDERMVEEIFRERGLALPVMVPWVPPWRSYAGYLAEMDATRIYANHGPLCRTFERRLAEYFHVDPDRVVVVTNGTFALAAAMMALAPPGNPSCLIGAFTFSAGLHAINLMGARAWLADIHAETWMLHPDAAADTLRDGQACDLIQISAPFGGPVDVGAWEAFQEETGIPVLIDWAAGFDCLRASSLTAILSFHATKAFAIGEGGAVIAGDTTVASRVRDAINFGHGVDRQVSRGGMNAKMSEVQAAVGLAMADAWPEHRARLLDRAAPLRRVLENHGIAPQPGWGSDWISNTCVGMVPSRTVGSLVAALDAHGIGWRRWWNRGLHREPAFSALASDQIFPVSDDVSARAIGFRSTPFSKNPIARFSTGP